MDKQTELLVKQLKNELQIASLNLHQISIQLEQLEFHLQAKNIMDGQQLNKYHSNETETALSIENEIIGKVIEEQKSAECTPTENHKDEKSVTPTLELEKLEHVSVNTVLRWIETKNFQIKSFHLEEATDEYFDSVALFIGSKFEYLKSFIEQFRRSMSLRTPIFVNLQNASPEQIGACTQLCTRLQENALLERYRYTKTSRRLEATPVQDSRLTNFMNGNWLERYVEQVVTKQFVQSGLPFASIRNVQLRGANNKDTEIDVLFILVDQPLWFECKTGDFESSIQRYSILRKQLDIPKENSFVVVCDNEEINSNLLSQTWELTFTNLSSFLQLTQKIIDFKLMQLQNKSVVNL